MCIMMERKRLESDTIVPFLVHLYMAYPLTATQATINALSCTWRPDVISHVSADLLVTTAGYQQALRVISILRRAWRDLVL
jgi:hypothetical protein